MAEFEQLEIPIEPTVTSTQPAPAANNPEEKKKDPRGRKPGGKNKPKEQAAGQTSFVSNTTDEEAFFNATKKAAETKKVADKPTEQAATAAGNGEPVMQVVDRPSLITGYMMLIILDAFIPALMNRFIFKVDKKKLVKLDKTQREELRPIADAAAQQMFANVSPVTGFIVSYAAITVSNNMFFANEK